MIFHEVTSIQDSEPNLPHRIFRKTSQLPVKKTKIKLSGPNELLNEEKSICNQVGIVHWSWPVLVPYPA